ncbi:MAG: phosphate ABC transporter permease, partial [Methylococcaceae bacterium]|nr:phosphate ABC transporter permease [Methylococcaceae bacterium]
MSEINIPTEHSSALKQSSAGVHERWRLIKDSIARYGVIAGGLGVILAVVMIFFYLLYVVFPLFLSATAEPVSQYDVPESALGKTVLMEIEEQNEVAVRFTDK